MAAPQRLTEDGAPPPSIGCAEHWRRWKPWIIQNYLVLGFTLALIVAIALPAPGKAVGRGLHWWVCGRKSNECRTHSGESRRVSDECFVIRIRECIYRFVASVGKPLALGNPKAGDFSIAQTVCIVVIFLISGVTLKAGVTLVLNFTRREHFLWAALSTLSRLLS